MVGEDSFVEVANPDNMIYRFFSAAKRLFVGTLAEYLTKNSPCEVIVVPARKEEHMIRTPPKIIEVNKNDVNIVS